MDIRKEQRREKQLDAISAVLAISLLFVIGLMLYLVSTSGLSLGGGNPLSTHSARVLMTGFTILMLLYLWDQRQRLRHEVARKTMDLDSTVTWLSLAHEAASTLGEKGIEEGLNEVLQKVGRLLEADAAAVLGDEMDYTYLAEGVDPEASQRVLMHVVIEAVGRPAPIRLEAVGGQEGESIAVPLRIRGELRVVLCVWRREGSFRGEEVHALGLAGRMIELAIEREESLAEAHDQLEGTLRVLQYLVADKRPDYSRHAMAVADLASEIGRQLGMTPSQRNDLRLSGLIHDVGLMSLPAGVVGPVEPLTPEQRLIMNQHARISAEIAEAANFSETVQQAVRGHHERYDGTGYPDRLAGEHIPLEARILAACEAYDSMVHKSWHGDRKDAAMAYKELYDLSETAYDPAVVRALLRVVCEAGQPVNEETVSVTISPVLPAEEIVSLPRVGLPSPTLV